MAAQTVVLKRLKIVYRRIESLKNSIDTIKITKEKPNNLCTAINRINELQNHIKNIQKIVNTKFSKTEQFLTNMVLGRENWIQPSEIVEKIIKETL